MLWYVPDESPKHLFLGAVHHVASALGTAGYRSRYCSTSQRLRFLRGVTVKEVGSREPPAWPRRLLRSLW